MIKLKHLVPGATIGIIAPASQSDSKFIDEKILSFENLGFNVKKGKHIYDNYGYLAGSDTDRANDLMDMFIDPSIDAIVCFRGGYGSIRLISSLNTKIIRSHPKPFCGYSDITLLLNYITSKCGFTTFHSPMINSDFDDILTKDSFIDILTTSNKNFSYNLNQFGYINILNKRDFKGRLLGGNLSMICSAIGTPYEVNFKNSIMLIEEIGENPYVIDRLLSQMIYANKFIGCNGIILGHFTDCSLSDYSNSFTLDDIITQKLLPLGIPIIKDFPCGHSYPNLTLPIGCNLYYNSENSNLTISEDIFID